MRCSQTLGKSLLLCSMLLLFSACAHTGAQLTPAAAPAQVVEAKKPVVESKKPVAEVNGTVITRAELDRAKKVVLANKPGLMIPPLLQKEFEVQTLNQLITAELLFQESRKLEIKDLDKQAQEKVAEIRKAFADGKALQKELDKIGVDERELVESTRRDLAIAYLVNAKIAAHVEVSEEEIKKFFDQNPDNFRQPEQVRASHILIGVDAKAGAEERKAAAAKAQKLRDELVKGADFAELAKANSTCPSAKQGGDLGFFTKGRMVPPFETAAFTLQPGSLSEVVETQFGYHIIKVAERRKAENIPYAAAKEKISYYLKAQKVAAAVDAFVGERRKQAKVEMFL